jgi:hypothetical protein
MIDTAWQASLKIPREFFVDERRKVVFGTANWMTDAR